MEEKIIKNKINLQAIIITIGILFIGIGLIYCCSYKIYIGLIIILSGIAFISSGAIKIVNYKLSLELLKEQKANERRRLEAYRQSVEFDENDKGGFNETELMPSPEDKIQQREISDFINAEIYDEL